jgi:hypothetical protein
MTDLAHLQRPRATCCQAISKSQSVDGGRWSVEHRGQSHARAVEAAVGDDGAVVYRSTPTLNSKIARG